MGIFAWTNIGQRMEWTSFQWVHCYWTESWVSIFPMSTLILDREWSGYLSNDNSDIGQRMKWVSFLYLHWYWMEWVFFLWVYWYWRECESLLGVHVHWYWTENGVGILPLSTTMTDVSHDCSLPRRHAFHRLSQLASDKIMLPCRCWLVNHWITRRSFILFLELLNHFRIPDNQC